MHKCTHACLQLNERSNGSSYLTVSGERHMEKKSEDKARGFFSERRSFGSFSRSIPVPEHVKVGEIKADHTVCCCCSCGFLHFVTGRTACWS